MKQLLLFFLFCSLNSYGQTQLQLNERAKKNYVRAETELEKVYQQVIYAYRKDKLFIQRLKIAQNQWVKFRDAEMNMKFPPYLDNTYGTNFDYCWYNYKRKLTQTRTATLRQWLIPTSNPDGCSGSEH